MLMSKQVVLKVNITALCYALYANIRTMAGGLKLKHDGNAAYSVFIWDGRLGSSI